MEQKLRRDCNMGDNLRRLRNDAGFSQEELCAKLQCLGYDVGRSTYAKYEHCELNIPIRVIIALRNLYKCSYDEFFVGLSPFTEE